MGAKGQTNNETDGYADQCPACGGNEERTPYGEAPRVESLFCTACKRWTD